MLKSSKLGDSMPNPDESAEAIRRRMAELRSELTCDVRDVKRSTREMADQARELASPMFYIRRFPWASAAAAIAVGYLLVPKKRQVIKPDPEMVAELIRKHKLNLDTSKVSQDKQSILQSLAMMGLTWAVKAGMNYATQHLSTMAANRAAPPSSEDHHEPAPSPIEEPWNTTG
jgi:ElaB/YqjD/DUF883 family membrane-anchored ribosome-binding protein